MTATLTIPEVSESWLPYSPEDDLEGKFGESLVKRAKKRKVEQPATWAHNRFRVVGDPKLGDAYESYTVTFDGRKYRCSCRDHAYGDHRTLCSHVLAVIMHRKGNSQRRLVAPVGGGEDVASVPSSAALNNGDVLAPSDRIDGEVEEVGTPDPRHPMFGEHPPLPEWVREIRSHQWQAVVEIVERFEQGDRVVFVDAPTGSGKTLLAELVRRVLGTRALYVCSTKSLQEQAMRDFPYARVLKGRANYPTADDPDAFDDVDRWGQSQLTAADCTKQMMSLPACAKCPPTERDGMHCAHCHPISACAYECAKRDALAADLTILNTSYFLTEANGPAKFSADRNDPEFGLVIVDEADLLETELMGLVEVRITDSMQKKYGIKPPEKKTVEASWVEWVQGEAVPKIAKALKKVPSRSEDVKVIRERQRLERLRDRVNGLAEGLGEGGWVFDGAMDNIVFRPIKVDQMGPRMLWRHGVRWLLMSATILSPDLMAESLGLVNE